MKLTRDELNRLRDLILMELGKVNVTPSKEFPVAFWATWGEHPATGAHYSGTVLISDDEGFSKDFYEEYRAWLQSKGFPIKDLI